MSFEGSQETLLATPKQFSPMEVKKSVWAQEKGSRNPRARAHQTFLNAIAQQLSPHHTPGRETQTGEKPCSPERECTLRRGSRTLTAWAAPQTDSSCWLLYLRKNNSSGTRSSPALFFWHPSHAAGRAALQKSTERNHQALKKSPQHQFKIVIIEFIHSMGKKFPFFSQKDASGADLNENPHEQCREGVLCTLLLPLWSQAPHLTQKAALCVPGSWLRLPGTAFCRASCQAQAFQDPDPFSSPALPGSCIL